MKHATLSRKRQLSKVWKITKQELRDLKLYWQEQAAGSSQHFLAKRLDCRWRCGTKSWPMTYRLQGKNNAFIALPVCFSVRPCVASRDKLLSSRCPDFISSTFWRSHEDDDAWINTLLENLHTRPACWSFVVSGDFNALPNEVSDSLALSVAYVQDSSGAPSPSRWKGNRCIEFAAHTPDLNLVRCRYLDTVLSDHKVFRWPFGGYWPLARGMPTHFYSYVVQTASCSGYRMAFQAGAGLVAGSDSVSFHDRARMARIPFSGRKGCGHGFGSIFLLTVLLLKNEQKAVRLKSRPSLDLRKCRTKSQKLRNLLGRCLELQQQQGRRLYNHTSAPWRWACCEDDRCKSDWR